MSNKTIRLLRNKANRERKRRVELEREVERLKQAWDSSGEANRILSSQLQKAVEVCRSAVEYDKAINSCANDPDKMASHCTAHGETLDNLYLKWINQSSRLLRELEGANGK